MLLYFSCSGEESALVIHEMKQNREFVFVLCSRNTSVHFMKKVHFFGVCEYIVFVGSAYEENIIISIRGFLHTAEKNRSACMHA